MADNGVLSGFMPETPPVTSVASIPVADRSATLVDLSQTAAQAARYAQASKAANTRRAYGGAWADFAAWCQARGLLAMPADPVSVGLYLADHAGRLKVATLRLRLAGIAEAHRLHGHPLDGRHPAIRDVWAGIRRAHGCAPVQKSAATPEIIREMVRAAAAQSGMRALRDQALILVGFAAALRRSELVALDVGDVDFRPEGVVLRLARSKTDQDGTGAEIAVPAGAHRLTCPVRALRAWIEAADNHDGPLFRSIHARGSVSAARLPDRQVARIVQQLAAAAGLAAESFGGHSLRAGFATAAARAGVAEALIMRQTRHRSVAVMRAYVRRGTLFEDNAAGRLGL